MTDTSTTTDGKDEPQSTTMRIQPTVRDMVKERQRDGETQSGCIRRLIERDEQRRSVESRLDTIREQVRDEAQAQESTDDTADTQSVTLTEGQESDLVAEISHTTAKEVVNRLQ